MMDLNTRIPTNPTCPTLNLAVSVALLLYELERNQERQSRDYELATPNQIEGLLRAYSYLLDVFGFSGKKAEISGKALLSLVRKATRSSREGGLLASNLRKVGSLHLRVMKNK